MEPNSCKCLYEILKIHVPKNTQSSINGQLAEKSYLELRLLILNRKIEGDSHENTEKINNFTQFEYEYIKRTLKIAYKTLMNPLDEIDYRQYGNQTDKIGDVALHDCSLAKKAINSLELLKSDDPIEDRAEKRPTGDSLWSSEERNDTVCEHVRKNPTKRRKKPTADLESTEGRVGSQLSSSGDNLSHDNMFKSQMRQEVSGTPTNQTLSDQDITASAKNLWSDLIHGSQSPYPPPAVLPIGEIPAGSSLGTTNIFSSEVAMSAPSNNYDNDPTLLVSSSCKSAIHPVEPKVANKSGISSQKIEKIVNHELRDKTWFLVKWQHHDLITRVTADEALANLICLRVYLDHLKSTSSRRFQALMRKEKRFWAAYSIVPDGSSISLGWMLQAHLRFMFRQ